jgi:hypothetical protein
MLTADYAGTGNIFVFNQQFWDVTKKQSTRDSYYKNMRLTTVENLCIETVIQVD